MLKKVFMALVTIVVCVMLGAMVINVFFPNIATQLSNATENMVFKATQMGFDFNGDGVVGSGGANNYTGGSAGSHDTEQSAVEGFN